VGEFCYDEVMKDWKGLAVFLGLGLLIILQTSVFEYNWLFLIAAWFGIKQRWWEIFILGLVLDLVAGARIGLSSMQFLLVGGGVSLITQQLRLRLKPGEIHLNE